MLVWGNYEITQELRPSSLSLQHGFIWAHQDASISLVFYFVNVEANVWIAFSSSVIIRCTVKMISRRQVFYTINYKFTNLKVTTLCCKMERSISPPIILCHWVNIWHILTDILKNIKLIRDYCTMKACPVSIWKKGHFRIHISNCKVKWRNKSVIQWDFIHTYLVQLIDHPILWIPNVLFVYFLIIFSDKSFKLISNYTQKCQYNLYIKKEKPLCNTLNWGNWNSGFVKLGVR